MRTESIMTGKQLEQRIEQLLQEANLDYERAARIDGLQLDFLVHGPAGQRVVLEAKAWNPRGGNTARAKEQAARYVDIVKADAAFVVLPEMERNYASQGVVDLSKLNATLADFFNSSPRAKSKKKLDTTEKSVFAAMPFDRKYDDTYFVAMVPAANRINAVCKRVDQTAFSGDIVEENRRLIDESAAVIVDLSESKPNVLYEAGYAHALEKPVVHICSSPLEKLPFDVRNWNTMVYNLGQTNVLQKQLGGRLSSIMKSRRT